MKDGKVIQVLNPHEVVINLGAEHGIKEGAQFLVFAVGDELRDPDTQESLGALEIVRGRGRATHVQARLTTVRSDRTRSYFTEAVPRSGSLSAILGSTYGERIVERHDEPLPFEAVQFGDRVRTLD